MMPRFRRKHRTRFHRLGRGPRDHDAINARHAQLTNIILSSPAVGCALTSGHHVGRRSPDVTPTRKRRHDVDEGDDDHARESITDSKRRRGSRQDPDDSRSVQRWKFETSKDPIKKFHKENTSYDPPQSSAAQQPGCSFWGTERRERGVTSHSVSRDVTHAHKRKSTSSYVTSTHQSNKAKDKYHRKGSRTHSEDRQQHTRIGETSLSIDRQSPVRGKCPGTSRDGMVDRRTQEGDARREIKSKDQIKEQAINDLNWLSLQDTGRDIAVWMATRRDALKTIVEMNEMSKNDTERLVRVLAKACPEKEYFEGLLTIVLPVVADSSFFGEHLVEWIMKTRFSAKTETTVNDICAICSSILQLFPNKCVRIAHVVSLLYANYDSQFRAAGNSLTEEKLIQIRKLSDDCNATLSDIKNRKIHLEINQFRKMPIIPNSDEICYNVRPKLNPHLKQGAYENVDAYLDTQFRLLREDFVAPLRSGICSFMKQQQTGHAGKQVDDVRVYHSVHVLQPSCGYDGISYRVQFNLSGWNPRRLASKKLLCYGSLVCLSCDGFATIHCGMVTNSDSLTKGIVDIRLQGPGADGDIYKHEYIMAESEAFFEAYRPVLKGLQQITEQTLPLQKYIIQTSDEVAAPRYLLDNTDAKYDLRSLFNVQTLCRLLKKHHVTTTLNRSPEPQSPLNPTTGPPSPTYSSTSLVSSPTLSSHSPKSLDIPDDIYKHEYIMAESEAFFEAYRPSGEECDESSEGSEPPTPDDNCDPSRIPLLRFEKWPGESVLCLDESQRRAVYSALTQEFAVIQGPPGTGKTYVGLKIMETLLKPKNYRVWSGEETRGPILVVCYTNHALDQFLEGVLDFEKNIVRIGGRSKSERLMMYNLKHVKYAKTFQNRRNRAIANRDKTRLFEMKNTAQHEIERKVQNAYSFNTSIVGFEKLERFMMPQHVSTFQSQTSKDVGIISEWLGLRECMAYCYHTDGFHGIQSDGKADGNTAFGEIGFDDRRVLDDELDRPNFADDKSADVPKNGTRDFDLMILKLSADNEDCDSIKKKMMKDFRYLQQQMQSTDKMSYEQANNVGDVWRLNRVERWRLYRYWVDAHCMNCLASTTEYIGNYNSYTEGIREVENEEVCRILRDVKVIGMTTTGAAKWQSVLKRVGPRIVVVEEAAEVMEAHVITTLSEHCQHLILIGDHQQLKPNPAVYRLAKQYHLDLSLFERMINNDFPRQTLARQHRMRPEIADVMRNHFYRELQDDISVRHMGDVRGVSKNMFFINHSHTEDSSDDGLKSHSSKHETDMTVALCKYLLQQGYSPEQVTILTVYTGQLLAIKSRLAELQVERVRACVVDNFQGEECDIILLSLVRSNEKGKIGFLATHNRICVMLSRAKLGLFCIGNFKQLAAQSDKWKSITNEMREKQLLGSSLLLACSLHPDVKTQVACAADFKRVPEGGCTRPCEYRLPCGHVCTKPCHPSDPSHQTFMCYKPCTRIICEANHRCQKTCGERCPKLCERKVKKKLPKCSHEVTMKCFNNPAYIDCVEKCERRLPCGHQCRNTCGKRCQDKPCREKVPRTDLPCGHEAIMPCSDEADQCPESCRKLLACGHVCPGSCSSCHAGRFHVSCRQKCDRILVCGHKCRQPCASNCPPCTEPCENRCLHSKCHKRCWEPCAPCQELCRWRCRHHSCERKCSEPCDRPPCDRPCDKLLGSCGHRCIGMCGEPCPSKCLVCDKEEVTQIFFGTEDEEDAHFVELRDCGHIIEVNGFDQWMTQDNSSSPDPASEDDSGMSGNEPPAISVQVKSCPKCKTPIRQSTRYTGIINNTLADIEKVKSQVRGDSDQIARRKDQIKSRLAKITESPHYAKTRAVFNRTLESKSSSLYDLNNLLNQITFADEVVKLTKQLDHVVSQGSPWCKKTSNELKQVAGRLLNGSRPFRGTAQELLDFPNELSRLSLCCKACAIMQEAIGRLQKEGAEDLRSQLDKVDGLLFRDKPLTKDSEQEAGELLQELGRSVGGLGVSGETRIMITKAIGLSQGHWFKCPNGHVYAIGECGGAMQRGVCPECKTAIGGASHRLESGNAVATEMDEEGIET